jgi:hypothetical protein
MGPANATVPTAPYGTQEGHVWPYETVPGTNVRVTKSFQLAAAILLCFVPVFGLFLGCVG